MFIKNNIIHNQKKSNLDKKKRNDIVRTCINRELVSKNNVPIDELKNVLMLSNIYDKYSYNYLNLLTSSSIKYLCYWEGIETYSFPRSIIIQRLSRNFTNKRISNKKFRIIKSIFYNWRIQSIDFGCKSTIYELAKLLNIPQKKYIWHLVELLNDYFSGSDYSWVRLQWKSKEELLPICNMFNIDVLNGLYKKNKMLKMITKKYSEETNEFLELLMYYINNRHDFGIILRDIILPRVKKDILFEQKKLLLKLYQKVHFSNRWRYICENEYISEDLLDENKDNTDWLIIAGKSTNRVNSDFLIQYLRYFDWFRIHECVKYSKNWENFPPSTLQFMRNKCSPKFWEQFCLMYNEIFE